MKIPSGFYPLRVYIIFLFLFGKYFASFRRLVVFFFSRSGETKRRKCCAVPRIFAFFFPSDFSFTVHSVTRLSQLYRLYCASLYLRTRIEDNQLQIIRKRSIYFSICFIKCPLFEITYCMYISFREEKKNFSFSFSKKKRFLVLSFTILRQFKGVKRFFKKIQISRFVSFLFNRWSDTKIPNILTYKIWKKYYWIRDKNK